MVTELNGCGTALLFFYNLRINNLDRKLINNNGLVKSKNM